jgi:hypothetical protein
LNYFFIKTKRQQQQQTNMNTNDLKTEYRNYLLTPEGRDILIDAVDMMKQWKARNNRIALSTTDFVDKKNIPSYFTKDMKLIKINPIALNNKCFFNSKFFKKYGYEEQLGYNITACKCGKQTHFEIHSVNRKDGVYYDFTRDYNDETEKWFYPLQEGMVMSSWIQLCGRTRDTMNINTGCKCCVSFKKNKEIVYYDDWEEVEEWFDFTKRIRVLCF